MKEGQGWLVFAWLMLLISGVMAVADGIIALSRSSFFDAYGANYVAGDLATWGWIALILGIATIVAAFSVWKGGAFGRWFGIGIASVGVIVQLGWIPIVPFWALAIMLLDILVIYGLAVYGGQRAGD